MSSASATPLPDWATPATPKTPNRRPWKVFGWIAALMLVVGGAAAVFLWLDIRPTPTVLLLVPAPSSDPYAPDTSTVQAFIDPFRKRVPNLAVSTGVSRWKASLDELVARQPRNVVLMVLGQGCHDERGPFVMHDNSADRIDAVNVSTILEALQRLPARTPKLIVFDVTVHQAVPSRSQIHNGFAAGLSELDDSIRAIPNLVVVCSSGVDERSAVSEIHGRTAFQQAMIDQWSANGDALADGRLFTHEWLNGVVRQTTQWTREQRAEAQTPMLLPSGDESRRRSEQQLLGNVGRTTKPEAAPVPFEPSAELSAARQRYIDLNKADWHPTQWVGMRWMRYGTWLMRAEQASVLGHTQEAQRTLNSAEQERLAILRERDLHAPTQTTLLDAALGSMAEVGNFAALLDELHKSTDAKRTAAETAWAKATNQTTPRHQATREILRWLATDPLPRRSTAERAVALMDTDAEGSTVEQHSLELFLRFAPKGNLTSKVGLAQRQMFLLRLMAEECWARPGAEAGLRWFKETVRQGDAYRCPADDHLFADGDEQYFDKALRSGKLAVEQYSLAEKQSLLAQSYQRIWATAPAELMELAEVIAAWPTDLVESPPNRQREQRFRMLQQAWEKWFELNDEDAIVTKNSLDVVVERAFSLQKILTTSQHSLIETVTKLLAAAPAVDRAELIHRGHLVRACLKWSGCPRRMELLREWHRIARELHLQSTTTPTSSTIPPSATEQAFAVARWRGILELVRLQPSSKAGVAIRFRFDQFARQANPHRELLSANAQLQELRDGVQLNLQQWHSGRRGVLSGLCSKVQWPYGDGPEPMVALRKQRAAALLHWQAERTEAEFFAGLPGALPYYQQAAKRLRQRALELNSDTVGSKPASGTLPAAPVLPRQRTVTDEASPTITLTWQTTSRPDLYAGWFVVSDGSRSWLKDSSIPGDTRNVSIIAPQTKLPLVPTQEFSTTTVKAYFRGHITTTATAIDWHRTPHIVMHNRPPAPGAAVAIRGDAAMLAKLGRGAGQLVFAIDATGSLAQPDDDDTAPAPFQKLCDTLAALLEAVPSGVQVGVVVFGHRQSEDLTPEKAVEEFRKLSEWEISQAKDLVARIRAVTPWNQSAVTRQILNLKAALATPRGEPQAVILLSDCLDNRFDQDVQNSKKQSMSEALRSAFDDGSTTLHIMTVPVVRKVDQAVQEKFAITKQFRSPGLYVTLDKYRDVSDWIKANTGPRLQATLMGVKSTRTESLRSGRSGADLWSAIVPAGEYRLSIQGLSTDTELSLADGDRVQLELQNGTPPHWRRVDPFSEFKLLAREGQTAVVRQRMLGDQAHTQMLLEDQRVTDIWMEEDEPTSLRWSRAAGWPSAAWELTSNITGKRRIQVWVSPAKRFPAAGTIRVDLSGASSQSIKCGDGELKIDAPIWETVNNSTEEKLVIRWVSPKDQAVILRPTSMAIEHECRLYRVADRGTLILPSLKRDSVPSIELEFVTLQSIKDQARSTILNIPAAAPGLPFTPPIAR
jgi:hypothetical protein